MTGLASELKKIAAEARAVISRQIDDAEIVAGLRQVATDKGFDWSRIKAIVKAQLLDERDESGCGKHVKKIVEKADAASAYAGMLGLVNEKNFSEAAE